jgi:flagellar export protein FliJ
MKKFIFRLKPVLTLREQVEKIKQKEYAVALHALSRKRGQIVENLRAMEDARSGMRAAKEREVDMGGVVAHRRYLNYLEARLVTLCEEESRLARQAEAKRLELLEAAKKKKSLDKLLERQKAEYDYEAAREERKFFDEVGSVRAATGDLTGASAAGLVSLSEEDDGR